METFHQNRLHYQPRTPKSLKKVSKIKTINTEERHLEKSDLIAIFPATYNQPILHISHEESIENRPLSVGVVLSGGQAPGGHNVITGLFDALKEINPNSKLIGFLNGPAGIIDNKHIEITEPLINQYRNQGGFDLIGSGRTKIETPEQFAAAEKNVRSLHLDGLVVVGGDDSNTNAAFLAEYFLSKKMNTCVIGVPKTIDGDLKNEYIEISFGFDTAVKTYSQIIGNLQRDAISAKKYYYFIKLMGRTASHITLECALQTHPNLALISEEIERDSKKISIIIKEICDLIESRAQHGKDYGVILIPEGLLEFIPECKQLIKELNNLLVPGKSDAVQLDRLVTSQEKIGFIEPKLSAESKKCFQELPQEIQVQLLLDRDPHGNVQVSKIETERLLMEMVQKELKQRMKAGTYGGKFSPQPYFCGYEGRSCYPSNFDTEYCYALGMTAAILVNNEATGYMAAINKLSSPVEEWQPVGVPLSSLMTIEQRHGKSKAVIRKALVDLKGRPFETFLANRSNWGVEDDYHYPGPIQYYGPSEVTNAISNTLRLESEAKAKEIKRRDLENSKRV